MTNQFADESPRVGAQAYVAELPFDEDELESLEDGTEAEAEAEDARPRPFEQPLGRNRSVLGEALRKMRENAKISQAQLSKRADVRQSHISQIECGPLHPRRSTANKIADGLKVNRNEFWEIVCQSKAQSTGRVVNDDTLTSVGSYVPKKLKDWYQKRANQRGITMSRLIAEVMRSYYSSQV